MTFKQIVFIVFHKNTLALIAFFVFLWFTISLIIDSNLKLNNLTKHKGKVLNIYTYVLRVVDKPLLKETTKELRLKIDTENKEFTLSTTKDFNEIISNVSIGDSVSVYTKEKMWGIFGMKLSSDISHLEKKGKDLVDFEKYRKSLSGLFIMTLIFSIGFLICYIINLRRQLLLLKSQRT